MPICKAPQSTNRKTWNVNLLISLIYLCSSPAYAACSRGPFLWTLWSRARVPLLWMVPVSASLPYIFVPYPCPVSLSRSPVPHPCPEPRSEESNLGGQIESVSGSTTVSEFSFIRQANPLNGGAFYMKRASWRIYLRRALAFGFWKSWERRL